MKALLFNPWTYLIVVVVLLATIGGGYWWGRTATTTSCAAKAGTAAAKIEGKEDKRDEAIEAIGAQSATATAGALNHNRGSTDESVDRIRTVVVPGDCHAVDPGILRELRAARDDANAALGVGLRPSAAGADRPDP